jgi:DNA-binding MarR family transcriptional regulator
VDNTLADDLIADLWAVFPPLFRLIRRGWQRGNAEGLSVYQYVTLGILLRQDTVSMSEIRDQLSIAKSNLTPIVDGLVQKGFVHRDTDKDDRRVIRISLTARGEKFMIQGRERARADMHRLFRSLGHKDLSALATFLKHLNGLLSQVNLQEE